jgi:hypothetical protein
MLPGDSYCDWKKPLKQYCYNFDHNSNWFNEKEKTNSSQLTYYAQKNKILSDQRWIYFLDNGTYIQTPNLPLFSQVEYDMYFGNSLDYLINESD